MAFGYHKWRRGKKRREDEAKAAEAKAAEDKAAEESRIKAQETALPSEEEMGAVTGAAQQMSDDAKARSDAQRLEDQAAVEASLNRDFEGLSEEQKRAMTETANRQISQQTQRANRQQQSEAGSRGFVGGDDALRIETQRLATEAAGQFSRDLAVMDADAAMDKLATAIAMEEGRAAEHLLQDQAFIDLIQGMIDKRNEAEWAAYFDKHGN